MNPNLKEILKEELQNLLNAGFIYPISDSEWVSPLVIVPKKNGKWRVCVDYRALNKATKKDHFPLPFIDQVLDSLSGKNFFSFLDGFSGYNQIKIAPQDQDKTTFTRPWGTFSYRVLPFGLCNAPATFQRAVLGIFSDMLNVETLMLKHRYQQPFTIFTDAETLMSNIFHFFPLPKHSSLPFSHYPSSPKQLRPALVSTFSLLLLKHHYQQPFIFSPSIINETIPSSNCFASSRC
jgi:hypothetical protein